MSESFPPKVLAVIRRFFEFSDADADTYTDTDDTYVPDMVSSDSENEADSESEGDSSSGESSASEAEPEGVSFESVEKPDVPTRSSDRVRREPVRYRASMINCLTLKT